MAQVELFQGRALSLEDFGQSDGPLVADAGAGQVQVRQSSRLAHSARKKGPRGATQWVARKVQEV